MLSLHSPRRRRPVVLTALLLAFAGTATPALADLGAGAVRIVPTTTSNVANCIPLGSTSWGFAGDIYRNVPAFTAPAGSKIAFDLGSFNDVDIHRNVYLAALNTNPGAWTGSSQGLHVSSWTKVVPSSQTPVNPRGDSTLGDYELVFTTTAPFTFAGGGLAVGFGVDPAFSDGTCDGVAAGTNNPNDSSGHFYGRFYLRGDQTTGTLDSGSFDTAALIGMEILPAASDATPPVVTPNISGSAGDNGWYTGNVHLSWSVSDPDSTVSSTAGCGTRDVTTDTTGVAFGCSATSAGGTAEKVVTIKRDATPPTITLTDRTPANADGWNDGDVTLTWSCADATSGAVADTVTRTVSTEGADQAVTATCRDKAGNTAGDTQTVSIDTTPPTITLASRTPANGHGWNNTDVSVSWSCADSVSGATHDGDSQTLTTEGADQSATGTCSDHAGNTATDTQTHIDIDKTPPTVTYSGNAGSYTVAQSVAIACHAADGLSGLDSSTCSDIAGDAYTFALGTNSFSAGATDNAGNHGSGSTSFTVTVDTDSLCTLTKRWVGNAGVATALCAKLDAAKASAARGDANGKSGQLGAYRNQLAAQSGKAITADHAATLAALSQSV